nr:immunoglobulin heavy chain junction region [Mus musculus]
CARGNYGRYFDVW